MAFEKGKNQNKLTDKNINKIIETYRNRVDVDKYAHVTSLEEIKENEFNLNIPRYVDTFEEEQVIDLGKVNKLLEQDKQEIAELEAKINEQLKIWGIHV
ncbi:N-6 DNA methylase [Paenibacillus peoriae]|uniref:N-6 DNA methylase n=1 Tax=Paenibacillus peoriae TaxID=59893 RepID=UPI0009D680A4|nr:N-6 DNA methylase [Paenibacillus peoriae]